MWIINKYALEEEKGLDIRFKEETTSSTDVFTQDKYFAFHYY